MAARKQINPFLKLALEIGPLVVFFIANGRAEMMKNHAVPARDK